MRGVSEAVGARRDLVGRDAELARLGEMALDAAHSGRGSTVIVRGESGIGKTALLRTLLQRYSALFSHVVAATAEEFERQVPFAAACAGLQETAERDDRAAKILHLAQYEGGRPDAVYAVVETLLGLFEDWCSEGPVLWVLDDLQWVDPVSAMFAYRLGTVSRQSPLLLAVACRSGELDTHVERLLRGWRSERVSAPQIDVGPLGPAAVDELLASETLREPGRDERAWAASAAGNPYYLLELITARRLAPTPADGDTTGARAGPLPVGAVPPSAVLLTAVRDRLAGLSPRSLEVLQMASLLRRGFRASELATALRVPVSSLLEPLSEASRAGILDCSGEQLTFRHGLIRDAIANDLPPTLRHALHVQIASTLWEAGAVPADIAVHLLAAGAEEAARVRWLPELAGPLSLSSPGLTVDLLGPVAASGQVARTLPNERIHAALASSLLQTGDADGAEATARAALVSPGVLELEARLRWILALSCIRQGRRDTALREIQAALDSGRLDLARAARFHGLAAQCEITLGDTAAGIQSGRQALTVARDSGDHQAIAHALFAAATLRSRSGWIEEGLALADEAVAVTRALGPRAGPQLAPQLPQGICLMELDRPEDAERAFEAALRHAQDGTGTDYIGWHYQNLAWLHYLQGRWEQALDNLRIGGDLPEPQDVARHMRSLEGLVAVHRADHAALARTLDLLARSAPPEQADHSSWGGQSWVRALASSARNRTQEALELLSGAWSTETPSDDHPYLRHYLVPDLVAFAVAADDRQRATAIAADLDRYVATRPGSPALRRSAHFAHALAAGDADRLVVAAEEHAAAGMVLAASRAREEAAAVLAREGRRSRAREELNAAVTGYESLEAAWDQARSEALLRTLGVRRGVRGPRRRVKFGWEALTVTERAVAELVAQGLSNPEIGARMFLSRRTVQGHVAAILNKLGVKSRVEVATALVRHNLGDGAASATPGPGGAGVAESRDPTAEAG